MTLKKKNECKQYQRNQDPRGKGTPFDRDPF